jgi:hypothetical protein
MFQEELCSCVKRGEKPLDRPTQVAIQILVSADQNNNLIPTGKAEWKYGNFPHFKCVQLIELI